MTCAKKAAHVRGWYDYDGAMNRDVFVQTILLVFVASCLQSCATDDGTTLGSEPVDAYKNSNADPATYGADGFTFNKSQPRRHANDFMFYYKRCTLSGDRSYYSRTDYWCSDP